MSKYKVIYDLPDFPIKKGEGGLYAILPYEKLDREKKALFKVGLADDFDKRFESYHTYYPLGFYYKNLLANPTKHREDFTIKAKAKDGKRPTPEEREKARIGSKVKYYKHIESEIFNDLEEHGADRLKATTRIRNADDRGGDTEWFYTNEKTLDDAFKHAFKVYGGRNLENHLNHINRNATQNKRNSTYTAEIHYKIYS
jgi:hypothetical protein